MWLPKLDSFSVTSLIMDFLAMFDDVAVGNESNPLVPMDVEVALGNPSSSLVPKDGSSQLVHIDPRVKKSATTKIKGVPLRGPNANPQAHSWFRHFCKARKKIRCDESKVLEALIALQKKQKTGKSCVQYNVKRLRRRNAGVSKRSLVLQAKMKCGKGNRFQRRFSMTDFLEVAFGEKDTKSRFVALTDLAKHFRVSRDMVRLMRSTVAASVFTKQIYVCSRIWQLCKASPPGVVAVRHAWDETAQDIQVALTDQTAPTRSAWKIMVQKISVRIIWSDQSILLNLAAKTHTVRKLFYFYHLNNTDPRVYSQVSMLAHGTMDHGHLNVLSITHNEVLPPVLLVSDSSENLFYGMVNHPFFESTNRILDSIRACGKQHVTLFELDGATGNERLYNYFLTVQKPGPFIELIKCRNHQYNLIEGSLTLTASPPGQNLLNLFFSFTHFVRTGGHFARLKQAAKAWVAENAIVHRVAAPVHEIDIDGKPAWQEHSQELKDYLLCTDRLIKSNRRLSGAANPHISGEPSLEPNSTVLKRRLDDFFEPCPRCTSLHS